MQRLPSLQDHVTHLQRAQGSSSFSRFEDTLSGPARRSRASTAGAVPENLLTLAPLLPAEDKSEPVDADIFENQDGDQESYEVESNVTRTVSGSQDDLPIEIQSLMERFLESLTAPVHPVPLAIEALSQLYQDFYTRAESHIATHIATLSLRLSRESRSSREQSPAPSIASTGSGRGVNRLNAKSPDQGIATDAAKGELQMLTATEIVDRKKARKQLEVKRAALEEAVEKGVCEKVYPRLWQHKSTDDNERDQKLRSRAAALSVVGISLQELLSTALSSDTSVTSQDLKQPTTEKIDLIREQLADARQSLLLMNQERYPLGKLQHLTEAHKNIVDTLSHLFPSLSSADEILPTLIYTLITSASEDIQVISNLNFIQRFRTSSKIDGEAAYCLTNLEASISFLENIDLSALRKDEVPQGHVRGSSRPTTPKIEVTDPLSQAFSVDTIQSKSQPLVSPTHTRNRSSSIRKSRPKPLEYASDAMLNTAEFASDTIHSALEGSFKFLFGRLREKQAANSPTSPDLVVPKTLEDARKLVTSPSLEEEDEVSITDKVILDVQPGDLIEDSATHRPLEMIAGRRAIRDRSADSIGSGGSGKRAAFSDSKAARAATAAAAAAAAAIAPNISSPAPVGHAAVESMRYLGNQLNPLNRLGSMGMIPRFGRGSGPGNTPVSESPSTALRNPTDEAWRGSRGANFDFLGVAPPIGRFLSLKDPKELTIYEVEVLLADYQRLSGAIKAAQALQERTSGT